VLCAEGQVKIDEFEVIERIQIEYGNLMNAEKIKIKGIDDKYFIDISQEFPTDESFYKSQTNFFSQFNSGKKLN